LKIDSCYNMMQCVGAGHQIVALANLRPAENKEGTDELDSYMYQTVGHHAIDLYAEAMDLPLYRHTIKGTSVNTGRVYTRCEGDEVEDLYHLLSLIKEVEAVEGVSVGAILSDYQRVRVEDLCKRLNLQTLAYLWRRNQEALLKEMISSNIEAMIIKVAAFGLNPDQHLGKTLDQMEPYLLELSKKYGVHVCGEGGEYETFTLDCPLFKKKIVVDSSEVVVHSADAFAPVAYLRLLKLHLEDKANKFLISGCACEVKCDEDNESPISDEEGQKKTVQVNMQSLRHNSLKYSTYKTLEYSGRSLNGYRWISGVTAHLWPEDKSVQDAAKEAFSFLCASMNSEGLELTDIILVHLYVKSMNDFAVINSVYVTKFDLHQPARVCVEALLPDGVVFQMDCLAHKCDATIGDIPCYQKQVMHVQSISHWAPANIGPYSQSIQVGEGLYCAGQIALVPCIMQLISGGIQTEARVSLSHVEKILEAMSHNTELHHVLMANCYVTESKYIPVAQTLWQKKLRELKKTQDTDLYSDAAATSGTLAVVVVPCLPREAVIEWHVIAVLDDPMQRKHFVLKRSSEGCQIKCEAVESSSASSASVSISLSMMSPSVSSVNLFKAFRDMVAVFRQAVEKLSEDFSAVPLCSRTFYKDSIDTETLHAGLQEYLEEQMDKKAPALVLVPVVDLPDQEIIHMSCWLSL
uniref:Diphthine--ammonia ligase n=1 Tax=Sphenodon punctatus TaxID=8508 RepID=A0A8D0GND5_SPHPU